MEYSEFQRIRKALHPSFFRMIRIPDMQRLGATLFAALVLELNLRSARYDILESLRPVISGIDELFWAFADEHRAVLFGFWADMNDLEAAAQLFRASPVISDVEMQAFSLETSDFAHFLDFSNVMDEAFGGTDIGDGRNAQNDGSPVENGRRMKLTDKEKNILAGLIENPDGHDDQLAERTGLSRRTVANFHKKFMEKKLFWTVLLPNMVRFGKILAIWTAGGEGHPPSFCTTQVAGEPPTGEISGISGTAPIAATTGPALGEASPGRPRKAVPASGGSGYVPVSVAFGFERPQPKPTEAPPEAEMAPKNGAHPAEATQRNGKHGYFSAENDLPHGDIPGMEYVPRITPHTAQEGAKKDLGAAAQQPAGKDGAATRDSEMKKDKFSLGDLEATLAMSMKARAARPEKPIPPHRIARSGTFVWDVEKLGPPRRNGEGRTQAQGPQHQYPSLIAPVKRGRGRPRKYPVTVISEAVPKRPRGRPPKVHIPETAAAKRKRGRPPMNPLKRRKGRPAKRSRDRISTDSIPMPMERFVRDIAVPTPLQKDMPIILDVTDGPRRLVLGLFQDRSTARHAVHHLRDGVFLDGRRMKRLETRRLAMLREMDFGPALKKLLGRAAGG